MMLQRILHTTLVHPMRPEFSFSALALDAHSPAHTEMERLLEALRIEPISGGAISDFELKQVVAFLLCDDPEVFDLEPRVLLRYVNEVGIQSVFLDEVVFKPHLAPAGADVEARSLLDLVRLAAAAEVGLFAIPETETSTAARVGILVLALADGLITCGASRNILRALDHGLHDRITALLAGPVPA